MDITKRFNRILGIFFLLQSKALVSLGEIRERFDVSERTIFRDLKALEEAGIPVLNEQGLGYSLMEGFRMAPSRFTEEEILSLMVAEKMMQQHETLFVKQHFDAALIKIKSSFRFHQKEDLLHLEDKLHYLKRTKTGEYLPNVLDILLSAILKKKRANVHYIKRHADEISVRMVEPVGVFYESANWYLIAWCHLRQEYRNFRLDRIKKIALSDEVFSREHPSIETLRNQRPEHSSVQIIIRVDKQYAHYLTWEREMFGYAREEVIADAVVMHFNCQLSTHYFVRWFMMFADMGEIIAPVALREELGKVAGAVMDRLSRKSDKE